MNNLLIFLVILVPTIQYRVELGSFSFALMEPIILLCLVVLVVHQFLQRRLAVVKDLFILLLLGLTLWALLIRPWAQDFQNGLSDIRDWVIPTLGYVMLVSILRRKSVKWILLFLVWAILLSLFGIYQHFTDSARPFLNELAFFKTGYTVSEEDFSRLVFVSPAAGFFTHPNSFAMYIFLGLMTYLGWFYKGKTSWIKALPIIPMSLAIYWSFAKASLVIMVIAVGFFWLFYRIRNSKILIGIFLLTSVISIPIIWAILEYLPSALLSTFQWRIQLWEIAFEVIRENPLILIFGNGLDIFSIHAFYPQPHNLYIYMLLQYGLAGLLLCLAFVLLLIERGWQLHKSGLIYKEPILLGLWIALVCYFLIGLVESNLMGIEYRTITFIALAFFTTLAYETKQKDRISQESTLIPI